MVDFSLSALICDADEPRAHFPRLLPPPPKGKTPPPPTPPPHLHLWMGSLEKKEKRKKSSLDFEGWHFKWSWGWYDGGREGGGGRNTDIHSHAKTGGLKVIISYLLRESQREAGRDPSWPPRIFLMLWLVKFIQLTPPLWGWGCLWTAADIQIICRVPHKDKLYLSPVVRKDEKKLIAGTICCIKRKLCLNIQLLTKTVETFHIVAIILQDFAFESHENPN